MLNFDTNLSNALKLGNTTSFWVLKLYYNDESSFIGVSEIDRSDGSDFYHGIVASWGEYQQSLDFFNFTTSTGNMSVNLINTEKCIQGGRFTDLFASKNFGNRKWELFQNTSQSSTYDSNMIAQGIISGDIEYDTKQVKLTLLDLTDEYHQQIPKAVIQNTASGDDYYFPNAPEKNIGKPIPMAYGDFHDITGIGTVPSIFNPAFQKGHLPAIITDNMNEDDGYVYANADTETLHTLDTSNIYIYNDGHFSSCTSANASLNNPQLKYTGTTWYAFIPINVGTTAGNIADGDFDTGYEMDVTGGVEIVYFSIPEISNLGDISSVDIIAEYGTHDFTVGSPAFTIAGINALDGFNPKTEVTLQSGGDWEFVGNKTITLSNTPGDNANVTIEELYIRVTFSPSKTLSKQIQNQYEISTSYGISSSYQNTPTQHIRRTRSITKTVPAIADYIYYSGKGRKYGSWITDGGRSVGYSTTDYIENPIFMIEDAIRTELSQANIDTDSFDDAGNTTNGHLGDIYNDAVSDIKFAFSQYKFINSKDFVEKIGQQCLSWMFLSGDGNFKIKTLRRVADYSSADKTIDYREIQVQSISQTKLGQVRNDITINYNHDYGQDQNLSHANDSDATSQGTGVNGVGDVLKLELDADSIIDSTTGTQLAEAYIKTFKDRKPIVHFTCNTAKNNDLEISDIIDFSNWDSGIDIYGSSMDGYWLVQDISKSVKKTTIKAIKVST